jgi:hypothetical protein
MLAVMRWLNTVAIIMGAIVVALLALVWRQSLREDSTVEMRGGETIAPRPPHDRRPGEFAE